jgi:hypothetical protein
MMRSSVQGRMRRLPLLIVLTLAVTGCLGNSSERDRSSVAPSVAQSPPMRAATSLTVTYPVSGVVAERSRLPGCPALAACHDVRLPRSWVRVAVRRFTCSPATGDYLNAAAACAALSDLERRRKTALLGTCSCPGMVAGYPWARATGRYDGRRVRIALDACSLCGLGSAAIAAHRDAVVLMPSR